MSGCHRRMGDVWVLDRAVTLEEILASLDILKEEYEQLEGGQRQLEVAFTGALLACGYTAALWGEEIPLVDIGMIRKHWDEGPNYKQMPHVALALIGRFKQTNGTLKTFIQPLAPIMSSGIQVQMWIGTAIEEYHILGVTNGPMFCTVSKGGEPHRAMVSHLDDLFHDILKRVQLCCPEVIPAEIKVDNVYSVR
ncbi:hypothetical protein ACA910_007565 [Epithemia clementina (nom. ined.)]